MYVPGDDVAVEKYMAWFTANIVGVKLGFMAHKRMIYADKLDWVSHQFDTEIDKQLFSFTPSQIIEIPSIQSYIAYNTSIYLNSAVYYKS